MTLVKVKVVNDGLVFSDGSCLGSHHNQDCCEHHYLDFSTLSAQDFEGLDFDLSGSDFFEQVEDYGIRLVPVNGHPISVPGYGYNNGYYSSNLSLVLSRPGRKEKNFDISNCQEIKE